MVPRSPTMPAPVGATTIAGVSDSCEKGVTMRIHQPLTDESQEDTHGKLGLLFPLPEFEFGNMMIAPFASMTTAAPDGIAIVGFDGMSVGILTTFN